MRVIPNARRHRPSWKKGGLPADRQKQAPTLLADVRLLIERPPGPDLRQVLRTASAMADAKGYLDWLGLEHVLCLEHRIISMHTGCITTERVYALLNLPKSI